MSAGSIPLDDALLAIVPIELQEAVRAAWEADRITLAPPSVLSGARRVEWYSSYDPAAGYYWPRLRTWLVESKGRTESSIEALDVASDEVLSRLSDPRPSSAITQCDDRGLVLGYIQSGKTANFTAVIAKAFDAGYRIVIVLSGLHNSLRRQTQLRLEDELGLVPNTSDRSTVGTPDNGREIIRMTRPDIAGDFQPGSADPNLLSGTVPLIFVVKKNASVLRRLDGWLNDGPQILFPVLVIDDEADQASINTGSNRPFQEDAPTDSDDLLEEYDLLGADVEDSDEAAALDASQLAQEVDPSIINGLIRGLLGRFPRSSYVGYTATPFANVLIDHEGVDREVWRDLYPRDFIISLPQPNGYVGPEVLFGRESLGDEAGEPRTGLDVVTTVSPTDAMTLAPGRSAPAPNALPASLYSAILDFFLGMAARDVRLGSAEAGAMLIHGSSTAAHQAAIADLVREHVAVLRQRWRYNIAEAEPSFAQRWATEFESRNRDGMPPLPTFDEVRVALSEIFRVGVPTILMNHLSDDELDYERDPALRAIVVGGNKLSRGLTIEGLMVSYYVRSVNTYDTLLQMGRWFGFRADYVDLTRLFTTADLQRRFKDLATAEEDLRREIKLYEALGKSPVDFGPKIRSHPSMLVTARNRMGAGRVFRLDLSATLIQTILFDFHNDTWLSDNVRRVSGFLTSLGLPTVRDPRLYWEGVDWRLIASLMSGPDAYQLHPESTRSMAQMWSYVESKINQGELTTWRVGVRSLLNRDARLGEESLLEEGAPVWRINRSREIESPASLGSIANPASSAGTGGDEELGLSADDRSWARDNQSHYGGYARALRARRPAQDGLLLIYPISPKSAPESEESENKAPIYADGEEHPTILGLAWSLPASNVQDPSYIVGSAGAAS